MPNQPATHGFSDAKNLASFLLSPVGGFLIAVGYFLPTNEPCHPAGSTNVIVGSASISADVYQHSAPVCTNMIGWDPFGEVGKVSPLAGGTGVALLIAVV